MKKLLNNIIYLAKFTASLVFMLWCLATVVYAHYLMLMQGSHVQGLLIMAIGGYGVWCVVCVIKRIECKEQGL